MEIKFEINRLFKCTQHIAEVTAINTAIYDLCKRTSISDINPLETDGLPFAFVDERGDYGLSKQMIVDWVFKKSFEDFTVALNKSLIEVYTFLQFGLLADKYTNVLLHDESIVTTQLNAIEKKATKLHFPQLILEIEKIIGKQLPLRDEILSVNQVRNCLVHKDARVTEEPALVLKYFRMKIIVEKDGAMVELTKEIKSQRFRSESIEIVQSPELIEYPTGSHLSMTPDIFKDVTYTCILFVNELISLLPIPQEIKDRFIQPFTLKLATVEEG